MQNARLDEAQARIKIARRNINNFRYADDTYGKKWRRTKDPLDKGERGGWKSWLKIQHSKNKDYSIQSHHFMAYRWGNSGNSDRLSFLGLQNHFSHAIKRHLLLGGKAMTNLGSILNSRDITLPTKVHIVKAIVFPIVMYECKSRSAKKAECQRTDAFEPWCWRRLVCKEFKPGNPKEYQSWIFIGRTDAEAEAPILWPPDVKNLFTGKDPDVGKDWRQKKRMTEAEIIKWHQWLNGHNLRKLQEIVKDREAWHAAIHRVTESDTTEWLNNNNNLHTQIHYRILPSHKKGMK